MRVIAVGLVTTLAACGGGNAPVLQPLTALTAVVNVELTVNLMATDSDNDALRFDVSAPGITDLKTRMFPATISSFANGVAVFRWTPLSRDRNDTPYAFDFSVSDGSKTTTETVQLTVKDSAGTGPTFLEPLGTGKTLQLSDSATANDCVTVKVHVDDTDATQVTIAEEEPKIKGATLMATSSFDATWKWCPSMDQKQGAQTQFQLILSADDMMAAKRTRAPYLIVLRKPTVACPGAAPVITHTPIADQTTVQDIVVSATITDDKGLKGAPLVYHSLTPPADFNDIINNWTTVSMTKGTGDTYSATIPNPVAMNAPNASAVIYYLIDAEDADNTMGMCGHSTYAPTMTGGSFTVTAPAAPDPVATCGGCTSDAQCATGSYCVEVENQQTFCIVSCGNVVTGSCDTNFSCSFLPHRSVNAHLASYCYPANDHCAASAPACDADTYEPNDGRTAITNAMANNALPSGQSTATIMNLSLCPIGQNQYEEDWYHVSGSGSYTVHMEGLAVQDLDLETYDSSNAITAYSLGSTDTEDLCATADASGNLFIRVFTFSSPTSSGYMYDLYDLTITKLSGACP